MLLSAVSVLVVAQSSSEIPEGLMNNPVNKQFILTFYLLCQFLSFLHLCKSHPSPFTVSYFLLYCFLCSLLSSIYLYVLSTYNLCHLLHNYVLSNYLSYQSICMSCKAICHPEMTRFHVTANPVSLIFLA